MPVKLLRRTVGNEVRPQIDAVHPAVRAELPQLPGQRLPDTGAGADDSIPADSSDADGHISFADCGFHWYPIILILVIAGYTGVRIKKIREELDEEY